MIARVLDILASRLNEHIQSELGLPPNIVGFASPQNDDTMRSTDCVDVTFLSIEPDPHSKNSRVSPASLSLEVKVAFSFHGESYGTALDLMYAVFDFFHRNVAIEIDAQETSEGLKVQIDQLIPSYEEGKHSCVQYPTLAPRLDYRLRIQEA